MSFVKDGFLFALQWPGFATQWLAVWFDIMGSKSNVITFYKPILAIGARSLRTSSALLHVVSPTNETPLICPC